VRFIFGGSISLIATGVIGGIVSPSSHGFWPVGVFGIVAAVVGGLTAMVMMEEI